jgi:UDP-galactopyranose mutase
MSLPSNPQRSPSSGSDARSDVVVIGGGVSGLSFALKAAQAGRSVTVLERTRRLGGCLHSERAPSGYWFELGAHTAYNSYGGFLDLAIAAAAVPAMRERGPARGVIGFLRDGAYKWLTPPKVLLELSWLEAALHLPQAVFGSSVGKTLAERFGAMVGKDNYRRVLGPFLSAVPSQRADGFPAAGPGSLFKKRPRRKEFLRSYGFDGGLQLVCDGVARAPGLTVAHGAIASALTPVSEGEGGGLRVACEDGRSFAARTVALASGPKEATALLGPAFPALAEATGAIATVEVDSVGVVLPREKAWMPACAFLVPAEDSFFSCVTRDPFPDEKERAFAFHFRPGLDRAARLRRVCEVLRVTEADFAHLAEKRLTLPSPGRDHGARISAIDAALARAQGSGLLALTGNYFEGLAIEDCVQRSFSEWARVSGALVAKG